MQKCEHLEGNLCVSKFEGRTLKETLHQDIDVRRYVWDSNNIKKKIKNKDKTTFNSVSEAELLFLTCVCPHAWAAACGP